MFICGDMAYGAAMDTALKPCYSGHIPNTPIQQMIYAIPHYYIKTTESWANNIRLACNMLYKCHMHHCIR